jgi:hypothetical protein
MTLAAGMTHTSTLLEELMLREIRGPKGKVVPVTDIADECNRDTSTIRNLATRMKFPLVKLKVKSRRGDKRRIMTFCVEPRNVPTLMKEAANLRRYRPGMRHGGGVIHDRFNGARSPVEVPVIKRTTPVVVVAAVTREALAAALKPFVDKGLAKLTYDSESGKVAYAVQQVEEFKI